MNENSYMEWASMTDSAIIEVIGKFIKHHRVNQNRTQKEVSKDAGISRSTLSLIERGKKINLLSLIQILRVLNLLYVMDIFKITQEISPIEYARLKQKKRKRARASNINLEQKDDLGW